jgi:DNA-binding transcriptional MerR regulator
MGDGSAARSRVGPAGLMSIGEVLALLRPEFPDTTISKLRFLEAEGLVEPQRTAAGYRKYTPDDVARLRFVLTAQRDHYLPLRVIREQLASYDEEAAARPARPTLVAVGPRGEAQRRSVPSDPPAREPAATRLTLAELLARSGIDEAVLAEIERLGLIVPVSPGRYDADALAVAEAVAGLTRHGLEPRHLRAYRAAADREVGLFTALVAPLARQRDPVAHGQAAEVLREVVGLSQLLHGALLRSGLRQALGR